MKILRLIDEFAMYAANAIRIGNIYHTNARGGNFKTDVQIAEEAYKFAETMMQVREEYE